MPIAPKPQLRQASQSEIEEAKKWILENEGEQGGFFDRIPKIEEEQPPELPEFTEEEFESVIAERRREELGKRYTLPEYLRGLMDRRRRFGLEGSANLRRDRPVTSFTLPKKTRDALRVISRENAVNRSKYVENKIHQGIRTDYPEVASKFRLQRLFKRKFFKRRR